MIKSTYDLLSLLPEEKLVYLNNKYFEGKCNYKIKREEFLKSLITNYCTLKRPTQYDFISAVSKILGYQDLV